MSPVSPTVARWELWLRLRRRRVQLGMDVGALVAQLGVTRNYWSAVENGRTVLSAEKLPLALDVLEFDPAEHAELLALRETAKQRGWWSGYPGLFDDELLRLFGLEHGAVAMRNYENLLIPGLFQTADYARALMDADISVRPVEVDQRIEFRLRRQQRLDGPDPLRVTAVVSEAALCQQIGGAAVLRAQLRHLAAVLRERPDTLELRVIPFTASACGVFGASTFHIIDFASAQLPPLAWQETVTARGILDDDRQVRELEFTYAAALRRSLAADESVRLVEEYAKER